MPVLKSYEPRSPVLSQSPPRKKFKLSLKLKTKKRDKARSLVDSDSENEELFENDENSSNIENKTTKSANGQFDKYAFGQEIDSAVIPPLPFSGLANLGNTCYLNAVLQVLRHCPGFLKSLVNLDKMSCQNSVFSEQAKESCDSSEEILLSSARPSVIHSINKLSSEMQNAEENYRMFGMDATDVKNRSGWTTLAVRPQDFVRDFSALCPVFGGYQQHDAQEFLRSFLGLVEEECVGLVEGEQQDNMKGTVTVTNSNDSKVRGGCKYPVASSIVMESEKESANTTLVSNCSRTQPCVDGRTDAEVNFYPVTPKLVSKSKGTFPDSVNIVKQLFEGSLLLQTCCLTCEGTRKRYEAFQDISVPVQNSKAEDVSNLSDSEDESDQDLNLSGAISKFASTERLNGDNKYFCDSCATLTEADISTYFEKLPQVLTIHLKRFQTSYGNQSIFSTSWVTKVTKSLQTPQQLSLKQWCSETCLEKDAVYTLFGVVMHNGMSSCSGHYMSYVNVDILEQQPRGKGEEGVYSNEVRSEVDGKHKEEMEVDGEYPIKVDQCLSGGDAKNATNQDKSVASQSSRNGNDEGGGGMGPMGHSMVGVTNGFVAHSSGAQLDASRMVKQGMDIDEGWVEGDGQCIDGKGNKSTSGCGLSEDNAVSSEGGTYICKVDGRRCCQGCSSDEQVFQRDILVACDEQHKGEAPSKVQEKDIDSNCIEKKEDLFCKESLSYDDDEDSCDYSEFVEDVIKRTASPIPSKSTDAQETCTNNEMKSGARNSRRSSLRSGKSFRTESSDNSDSSSDEKEPDLCRVPRSMDITKFFKPIPKSEAVKKQPRRFPIRSFNEDSMTNSSSQNLDKEPLTQEDQADSCSQTIDISSTAEGSVPQSQGSVFSALEASSLLANQGWSVEQEDAQGCLSNSVHKSNSRLPQSRNSAFSRRKGINVFSKHGANKKTLKGEGKQTDSCSLTKEAAGMFKLDEEPCVNIFGWKTGLKKRKSSGLPSTDNGTDNVPVGECSSLIPGANCLASEGGGSCFATCTEATNSDGHRTFCESKAKGTANNRKLNQGDCSLVSSSEGATCDSYDSHSTTHAEATIRENCTLSASTKNNISFGQNGNPSKQDCSSVSCCEEPACDTGKSHTTKHVEATVRKDCTKPSNSEASVTSIGNKHKTDASKATYKSDCLKRGESHDSSSLPSSAITNSSKWLKFDDAEVQEISAKDMNEILSPSTSCYSTPYLLFYYRC